MKTLAAYAVAFVGIAVTCAAAMALIGNAFLGFAFAIVILHIMSAFGRKKES